MKSYGGRQRALSGPVVVFAVVALGVAGCGESNEQSQVSCWDGSHPSAGACPPLEGRAALEWVAPKLPSHPQPTCAEDSPSKHSPTPKSVEILNCIWEPHLATLAIERYPDPETVDDLNDPWSVDGIPYGTTKYMHTADFAQRWWYYNGSPLVFELWGSKSAVDSLSNQLVFRPPPEVLSGQQQEAQQKPDLTAITEAMLVGMSSFPTIEGASWRSYLDNSSNPGSETTTPAECATFDFLPHPTQHAFAELTFRDERSFKVSLLPITASDQRDIKPLPPSCASFDLIDDGKTERFTAKQVEVPGLPDWANAVQYSVDNGVRDITEVYGIRRGVLIVAGYFEWRGSGPQPEFVAALGRLFADQASKVDNT